MSALLLVELHLLPEAVLFEQYLTLEKLGDRVNVGFFVAVEGSEELILKSWGVEVVRHSVAKSVA